MTSLIFYLAEFNLPDWDCKLDNTYLAISFVSFAELALVIS